MSAENTRRAGVEVGIRQLRAVAGAVLAALALGSGWSVGTSRSLAQPSGSSGALPPVPSVKILVGTLLSPAESAAYFNSQAMSVTDGLCTQFSGNEAICPAGGRPRAPEIRELARGLRYDPNLFYEYIRNAVDTEFQYGLQKGALGVIVDGSGTAFDQANLLVELLREADAVNGTSSAAKYKVGTIQLSAAQFAVWTGLTDRKAACDFLALGGIPAVVANGCAAGTLSTVTVAHVWVEANVNGGVYVFDPAYKAYEHKTGLGLAGIKSGMSFTSGAAMSSAAGSTGNQSGLPFSAGFDQGGLGATLQTWSSNLLTRLRQSDMQGADLTDVVGGRIIQPAQRPLGGWKQTSFAYAATTSATWTGNIPDPYRTKLTVAASLAGGAAVFTPRTFFVDEIYGRPLQVASTRLPNPVGNAQQQGWQPYLYKPTLVLDGIALSVSTVQGDPGTLRFNLELSADHPFPAASGSYGDAKDAAKVIKSVDAMYPATIVHGWGKASRRLAAKWEREQSNDRILPITLFGGGVASDNPGPLPTPSGDLVRARMAANWLAQFSRALDLHGELANARTTHIHSLGVVSAVINYVYPTADVPPPDTEFVAQNGFSIADETTVVDLETAFGIVSRANAPEDRRAAIHAIAAVAATLEGAVAAELSDSPDASSTARRLAWGNDPEDGESPDQGSRRVYSFAPGTSGQASGVVVFEGLTSGVRGWYADQNPIDPNVANAFRIRLYQTIDGYTLQGFNVVASSEALLGPGHRHGTEYLYWTDYSAPIQPTSHYKRMPTTQAGGALIATRYDSSGDPIEIAHVLTRDGQTFKGGGGSSITSATLYNPKAAGDVMKDRFVDRSSVVGVDLANGSAGFDSPLLASIGPGEFPYRLERKVELRGSTVRTTTVNPNLYLGVDTDGIVSNWDGSAEVSSSTLEAMGESRAEAAVPTIVAFVAMQDVYRSAVSTNREVTGVLVADWWGQRLVANIVTILHGGSAQQFLKLIDGSWVSSAGGADKVSVSGTRVPVRPELITDHPGVNVTQKEAVARVWRWNSLVIKAIGAEGDIREYEYWERCNGGGNVEAKWTGNRLKSWRFPQGVSLTLDYDNDLLGVPVLVTSSLGHSLQLPVLAETPCVVSNDDNAYGPATLSGNVPSLAMPDAMGAVTRLEFRAPVQRSLAQRPDERCPISAIYTAEDQAIAATRYIYDSLGRVSEARDAMAVRGQRGPHRFFIAEGYRAERLDPQTPVAGRYFVEWLRGGRLTRHVDELDRVVTTVLDGRRRVIERTFPEGDKILFVYDERDNPTSLTRCSKTGCSPGENLVFTALWHSRWNKPTQITDPMGRTTTFTYWDEPSPGVFGHGASLIHQAIRPPPDNGSPQPTYTYEYDSRGLPTRITDPDGVETTNGYDTSGCMISTRVGPLALGLLNHFACDGLGNVTEAWDARGVSTKHVTTYDAMRRPTQVTSPLGAVVKTTYDLEGRPTRIEKRLLVGATVSWQVRRTGYRPTGQVWWNEDPSGHVTRFDYDALDRKTKETAPTGDVTAWVYDLAGQTLQVRKAVGITTGPATEQAYETYTYTPNGLRASITDARSSSTIFAYDGFDRLLRTTFPDATWEGSSLSAGSADASMYDRAGNLLKFRTREGTFLARTYDNLDRKKTEKGLWTDGATSGFSHEWWRMRDASFTYTLAGRMLQASNDQIAKGWTYDAAGRPATHTAGGRTFAYSWDVAGNLVGLVYPGNLTASWAFDDLNRMIGASTTGAAAASVTLTYDTLSRRSAVTFGDASAQIYAWELDDDLASISHTFPNRTADNVSYTWTYDGLGRQVTETVSNTSGYAYAPANSNTAYGVANGLNQYPTVAGSPFTYRSDGPLSSDGVRNYYYDEKRNLAVSALITNASDTDYDRFDALGIRWFSYRSDPSAADPGRVELTDGLRPEVVWEERSSTPQGSSTATVQGNHYYVLGPNPDERLIWIDATAASPTARYPHTDRRGDTIAVAKAGQAETKFKYGPFGESGDSTAGYPWRFTGQRLNAWTGLYHYKARAYSTALGRFLQPDPAGFEDGPNLYAYVSNDPFGWADSSGLQSEEAMFEAMRWDRECDGDLQCMNKAIRRDTATGWTLFGLIATVVTPGPDELIISGALTRYGASPAARSIFYGQAQRVFLKSGLSTGHWMRSWRAALVYLQTGKYSEIHLNRTIRSITGGKVDSDLRPDVGGVRRKDGKVDVTEVASGKQESEDLERKYRGALGDRAGEINVIWPKRSSCPTGTRIC